MAYNFKDLPDIATIQPDRLIKYRISEDKFSAEVLLPGLWYTDFDKKIGGKLTIWAVAKIFESVRYIVLDKGFGYYDRFKDDQHSIFMASTEYQFTKRALSLTAKSHWGAMFPIYVSLNVNYAGTSSFTFDSILYNDSTGEKLISANLTFVYVDYQSRRPAKFPEWYNDVKRLRKFGPPIKRLPTPTIPHNAFTFKVTSNYSDIDFNGHVNQSIFVKWCSDAGSEAAIQGYLPDFKTEIGKYPENTLRLKYIGEGLVHQDFDVYTWQDVELPLTLNFVITRNSNIVFVATFSYLSNNLSSKL